MKESPASWAWTTISEIAFTSSGGTPSRTRADFYGGSIPWVKSGELKDGLVTEIEETITEKGLRNSSAKLFNAGTLCIALYGATVGRVGILATDAATNQAVCGIVPNAQIDTKYLFYFLQSQRSALIHLSQGGAQPNISQQIVRLVNVPICSFREQRCIVAEIEKQFTRLEAAMAALKRVQTNLKRYRASVLKAACEGHLVPTEAELARWEGCDYEPAHKLLERILRERRARWEAETLAKMIASGKPPKDDSWKRKYKEPSPPNITDLPLLPEGWCWASVDQVGMVQLGRQRSPEHHEGDHMTPYLRVANVFEDRVDTSDVNWMNFTPAERVTFGLREGDILLNEGQSLELIGRPAMYRNEIPGCCFQNTLVRFRRSESLDGAYALALFLAYFHSGRFQKIAKWTTNIAHLGALRFASLEFPLPPISEQHRIAVACEEVSSRAEHLRTALARELDHASILRQAILAGAFSGSLLPQDPNDEPASVLLERIRAERASATAANPGKRNKQQPTYA